VAALQHLEGGDETSKGYKMTAYWREGKERRVESRRPVEKMTSWAQIWFLPSQLWRTIGDGSFFLCHAIWGVAKLQDMGNKLSQTVGVALSSSLNGPIKIKIILETKKTFPLRAL
jgi:hypothetical protein